MSALPQQHSDRPGRAPSRVLHVIVGHRLPIYFLNSVRSVVELAPDDDLLVIDNASPDPELRRRLAEFATPDGRVRVWLRDSNDLRRNGKVGGLYEAYREAFDYARGARYEYVHVLQGDTQLVWWGAEFLAAAERIYAAHPSCVNITSFGLSSDHTLGDDLSRVDGTDDVRLRHYGLTDTGLFHLGRWAERGMSFHDYEQSHARYYLNEHNAHVVVHPWPCVAPIPWPAVIRGGEVRGTEIDAGRPLLLRPLRSEELPCRRAERSWLEDIAIPWGWTCLTPMWPTGVDSVAYLALRRRAIKVYGLAKGLPRYDKRGLCGPRWGAPRASAWRPLTRQLVRELRRRALRRT